MLGKLMTTGRDENRVVVDLSDVEDVGAVARVVLQAAQRRSAARGVTMELVGAERAGQSAGGAQQPVHQPDRSTLVGRS